MSAAVVKRVRRKGRGHRRNAPMSEINVTPFVDVMLVLLIIFMVAAPLATVDVNVDLPVSNATPAQRPDQPVYVTVKPDLTLALGNTDVAPGGLGAALAAATENNRETRIFLRADKAVAYGDLMATMNALREAGYLKIALVGLEAASILPQNEKDCGRRRRWRRPMGSA